jgi:serine/threonine protein kinase
VNVKTGRTTYRASTALLLELVPKTLEQHVRELGARMDAGRATALARQVVGALGHLYAHKVVHGDVKLNNFLVQAADADGAAAAAVGGAAAAASGDDAPPPRVVLTDFGCAVQHGTGPADMDDDFRVHAAEATNFSLGNPAHLAPEVVAALARKGKLARGSGERVAIPLGAQDAFAAGVVLCVLALDWRAGVHERRDCCAGRAVPVLGWVRG